MNSPVTANGVPAVRPGPTALASDAARPQGPGRVIAEIRQRAGLPRLRRLFYADTNSTFEQAGRAVRQLMPWLQADRPD